MKPTKRTFVAPPIPIDGGVHHVADPIAAAAAAEAAEQHQEPAAKLAKLEDTVEESATVDNHHNQHDDGLEELIPMKTDHEDGVPSLDEAVMQGLSEEGDGMGVEEAMPPLHSPRVMNPVKTGEDDDDVDSDIMVGGGVEGMDEEIQQAVDAVDKAQLPSREEIIAKASELGVDHLMNNSEQGQADEYDDDDDDASGRKVKKDRKEFTAEEKLKIINELNVDNPPAVQSVLEKYGVSKSSLHRWRQPEKLEKICLMVQGGLSNKYRVVGGENFTESSNANNVVVHMENKDKLRKRDMGDKLRRIKFGLQEFCKDNLNQPEDQQLAITSGVIRVKANEIKEELLKRHQEMPNFLTDDEVAALASFKGSKSWACTLGNQLGYLSAAGAPKWNEIAKANTNKYIEHHSGTESKEKKKRTEFTPQEKLAILNELEEINMGRKIENKSALSIAEICQKHKTSKSSLHRWKQQFRTGRLQQLAAANSGFANSKRIFNDKLHVVKVALNEYYLANEEKVIMGYVNLQSRALKEKDILLEKHKSALSLVNQPGGEERAGDILSEDEVNALQSFKASNSWIREAAKKFGWKLDGDAQSSTNLGGMVDGIMAGAPPVVYNHPGRAAEEEEEEEVVATLAVQQQPTDGVDNVAPSMEEVYQNNYQI